jgi:dipeptidyl aminopeptidase/acylaminoacyl peptidase
VKAVAAFSGPTDFFLPEVRRLAERAVRSRIPRVPGAGYMADSVLFALRDGRIGVARARLELLRRSPARFAHRLPPTQLHHGTEDDEVPIAHAERLDAAVRALGRGPAAWEYHRYPGGGHRPRTLAGSRERAEAFLRRVADLPAERR